MFEPVQLYENYQQSVPGRRSALPWAIVFGPLGQREDEGKVA